MGQQWPTAFILKAPGVQAVTFGTANPVTQNHMSQEHSPQLYEVS
jgi:hypothetical protein